MPTSPMIFFIKNYYHTPPQQQKNPRRGHHVWPTIHVVPKNVSFPSIQSILVGEITGTIHIH